MAAATENGKSDTSSSQSSMPPGMVMGPDGKPCKICTAFRNWKPGTTNYTEADSNRAAKTWPAPPNAQKNQKQQQQQQTAKGSQFAGFAALAAVPVASAVSTATETPNSEESTHLDAPGYRGDEPPPGCPPDVEQLGRATWTFLHTTAAYYPEKPNPTQRANMLMLLRSIPVLYPCTWCADDFGKDIEKNAPDVSGRTALSRWLCERHNEVNQKLGKEKFDCAKVDERWKDGPPDGRCD
ncbi:FAD-linked sulfhydryl oxidase ALR [Psilocybe cubensis]|uniref:FAD-linked sulfhydryl oxidase ALR n=2 Tax=Psilocybe cubensis TaxID=181762 RepID=A0ACB8GVQ4_PSICU|nr:FAD-linked sulfhydryl oxidase ALR [Psilocybe cubensis]KAH9479522.1 FAD-linked sulfhydryl oxidase ALR [Psilocybe cubensis]